MKTLSARIASIEWLIDLAIIVFAALSMIVFGLVVYGRSKFGLTAVLRNPNARNAIAALAAAVSTVVFIISTRFTYKLFVSTRASLELSRQQLDDQRIYIREQKRLEFQREDIASSTVKATSKLNPDISGILIIYKSQASAHNIPKDEKWEWWFRESGSQDNADSSSLYPDADFAFKILCIQHAEQYYELEF